MTSLKQKTQKSEEEILALIDQMFDDEEIEPRALQEIKRELRLIFQDADEDKIERIAKILYGISREKVYDEEARKLIALDKLHRGARYIEGYLKKEFRIEKQIITKTNPLVLIVRVWY